MEICDGCSLTEFKLIFKSFNNNNFAINFFEKHMGKVSFSLYLALIKFFYFYEMTLLRLA